MAGGEDAASLIKIKFRDDALAQPSHASVRRRRVMLGLGAQNLNLSAEGFNDGSRGARPAPVPVAKGSIAPVGRCTVKGLSEKALQSALGRLLGSRRPGEAETAREVELHNASLPNAFGLETTRAIQLLAAYIRERSGCEAGDVLELACPEQAAWHDLNFVTVSESEYARRHAAGE
ncbi:hypothetical protein T492DRAFT_833693 [Pavlovales sp. CCMP2436]|nr:hypothetical protein T492DRAFT_833693 [Pavlovales sp. CCMP2436]